VRTKLSEETQARKDFSREVESRRGWYGLKTNEALGTACGMTKATMRLRLMEPDNLTVRELRSMVQRLGLDTDIVLRFIGYDLKTIRRVQKQHQAEQAEREAQAL